MTTVLDCIERIPEALHVMLKQETERFQDLYTYLNGKKIKKVIFIASGSSYNSANTTRHFYDLLGLEVEFIFPNIFVNYHHAFDQDALYVVISQGGTTKLVYEALLKIKEAGCSNCSITAELDAPIAKEADVSIEMGCGIEEFLYRTIGYSTTVASCYQLALAIKVNNQEMTKEELSKYDQDFQKMIDHLKTIKEDTLAWYQKHRFSLMHKQQMMFAGTNDLWPVCNEADIKVMEMVPMITRSFELEEFIHGPQNAFDSTTAFFLLGRKQEDGEKVKAIAQFLKKEIGFCSVIGDLAQDERDLYFEPQSQYFSSLEYVTVAQVIAYKMADDHGRDLSRPVNGKIKNYIKKTL